MQRKEFRTLVSVEEARRLIDSLPVLPRIKFVELENALGRILAEDVITEINVPPFSRAVMDGYAVRAEDTYEASETVPVSFGLIGELAAGSEAKFRVQNGESVEIATGAQVPEGADAVVMVENTTEEAGKVLVSRPVNSGENIMKAGSDMQKGERVLRKGKVLGTREIGVLAAIGKEKVQVLELPVGIISTGDELVKPGGKIAAGQIYDTNSYTLNSGVQECKATPKMYGIAGDDEKAINELLDTAVSECSLILTSGSTSAGAGDVMYRLIAEKGKTLAHGINIKPGKPVVIGQIEGVPIIGLPGNPTSSLMIFNEFVAPCLRKSLGAATELKKSERGVMATNFRSEGRHQLLPVGLIRGRVYPADRGSGAITSLAKADGFIEIAPEVEFLEAGTPVEVTLFGNIKRPDLLIGGGACPGLDLLEDLSGLDFRVLNTGASGGFSAVAAGSVDLAGVNMPSEDGTYNVSTIKNMGLSGFVLIKGYRREQGLIVRKDSPISGLLYLPGKRFLNRNRGSGTRALLDLKLSELARGRGISRKELTASIPGYDSGAKSEHAICDAVLSGKADAGIGTRACAEKAGLGFVKIGEEDYDFVLRKENLEIPEVKACLMVLASKEFAAKLPAGIYVYEKTGEMIEF